MIPSDKVDRGGAASNLLVTDRRPECPRGPRIAVAGGMFTPRIFLLSPAFAGGKRGQLVLRDAASFPLAKRLRDPRARRWATSSAS